MCWNHKGIKHKHNRISPKETFHSLRPEGNCYTDKLQHLLIIKISNVWHTKCF